MAKIISLPNSIPPHTEATWLLAYAVLWHHDRLPRQEVAYAKSMLNKNLPAGTTLKKSFTNVCERLLLAGKLLQVEPAAWIDLPSIWFHPECTGGFSDALLFQQQVALKRQSIRKYQQGINVFSICYWQYIQTPNDHVLKQCYRRLLHLREYWLIQVWNNVIMLHHINK